MFFLEGITRLSPAISPFFDNCNELRDNYSVRTQRVTDEPEWHQHTRCELRR
ncbi:hypothetical protein K443DRAFT_2238 [Laccaria amethystina LaAM-08-1]|uniref:Uncharacterized protein n=1 Tax=Laccaria amethystina LaAM-08-1 TaxID=1095629 RepID=A0A0C9XRR7_9AGAR|nr:hypothetical protein K443DRAFT_2238 [Laccaria amethystina LaAM-08-1]